MPCYFRYYILSVMKLFAEKKSEDNNELDGILQKVGLSAKRRMEASAEWKVASRNIAYLPVAYSESMMAYQLAYFQGAEQLIEDCSLVVFHENKACGIWPLSLNLTSLDPVGSNGGAILPPLFVSDLPLKSRKSITKACLIYLSELLKKYKQNSWRSEENFHANFGISEWHLQTIEQGGVAGIKHDLYVNLTLSMAEIKSNFRKSYKSLINSGEKHWTVNVLNKSDSSVWDRFQSLHRNVAGRATRSDNSWMLQHQAVSNGDAFLVYLEDVNGNMVGGGLFHTTDQEALYAVGAYDRNLFHLPLGHVVQYHAIQEMKNKNIKWYCIGEKLFQSKSVIHTSKEISISVFKEGFSTHIFPRYCLNATS